MLEGHRVVHPNDQVQSAATWNGRVAASVWSSMLDTFLAIATLMIYLQAIVPLSSPYNGVFALLMSRSLGRLAIHGYRRLVHNDGDMRGER